MGGVADGRIQMKTLKITDATKDELIQYFFGVDEFGGGFRIGADKERFLLWLRKKRSGELLDAADKTSEEGMQALKSYLECVKKMNEEPDIEKKLKYAEQGNRFYELYEKSNKKYDSLTKKADAVWK